MDDFIRIAVLVVAAFVASEVCVVIYLHYRAWRFAPRKNGVIPLHVVFIASSHLMLMVVAIANIFDRLWSDGPVVWQTILFGIASGATLWGLHLIEGVERRRLKGSAVN